MLVKFLFVSLYIWGCSALPTTTKVEAKYEGWNDIFGSNETSLIQLLHFGKKSYYLGLNFKATYFQAAQFCGDIHMRLVSVESPEENDKLYKYIRDTNRGDNFWTSGSKILDGKHWIWMGKGRSVDYTNWAPSEPNSPNDHCLELLHSKNIGLLWADKDCNALLNFICEKENFDLHTAINNTNISSWDNVYENSYVSPNIPLLHYGAKSYFVGRFFKATFLESIEICKMIGMNLVTVTSEEENTRLYKYIRDTNAGDGFWSSGTRIIDGTIWIWLSTAEIVEYTNWLTGRPDNIREQCLHLYLQKDKGLFWNDLSCTDRLFYICEKPRDIYSANANARSLISSGFGDTIIPCADQHNSLHYAGSDIPLFEIQGKFYHLGINFKTTYFEALEFCRSHQMSLVSIETSEENGLLRKLLHQYTEEPNGFWTSARKLDDKWMWSSGKTLDYFNWARGEPNRFRKNEDCIEIYNDEEVTWNDQPCEDKRYFICERHVMPNVPSLHPILKIYIKNDVPSYNSTLFSDGQYYIVQEHNNTVKVIPTYIHEDVDTPEEN